MRSYEQIDREQAAYVKAANKALTSLSDWGYRWWSYSVSHCSFDLVVGDPSGKDNVVISLAACEYISGPVDWFKPHRLEVIFNCNRTKQQGAWEFVLQDKLAGFRVIGGVFVWRKNFNLLKHNSLYSVYYGGDETK